MRNLKMTANSLCLASLLTLVIMGRAEEVNVPQVAKQLVPTVKIDVISTPSSILGPIGAPVFSPLRLPQSPFGGLNARPLPVLAPIPVPALIKPALPKVAPVKPAPKTYDLAGNTYVQTHWSSGRASWYHEGSVTAWCNGRWSQGRWDFDKEDWVTNPRVKLYHPTWMGHSDWYHYGTYKNTIPTVAHKSHELGTFVLFRYNGRQCIAMVTDRGPYVGGRDWDLNPCLARKLGFDGVGTVEYTVLRKVK
jgi:hypothetical protein